MFYYDFYNIIIGIHQALLFGIVMGIFSVALGAFFDFAENIFFIPKKIYSASQSFHNAKQILKRESYVYRTKTKRFAEDFIYIVVYGIALNILFFIATDGVFRFYLLIFALGSTLIFSKIFGKRIKNLISKLLHFIISSVAFIIAIVILPIRKSTKNIFGFTTKFLRFVKHKMKFKKLEERIEKK